MSMFHLKRLIGLVLLVLAVVGCSGPEEQVLRGNTMGTTYTVKYLAEGVAPEQLKPEVDEVLVRVNDLMSTYQADSELSRFNREPVGNWFELSEETVAVLALARQIHDMSGGQFDVTIGPLVNLWGFGPDPSLMEVPAEDVINQARARVGMDQLQLEGSRGMRTADIYVDLSAIAKGYGVDAVVELLEARGVSRYLVEIGGELRARGLNGRDQAWLIAVESPSSAGRSALTTLPVVDRAVATSGDYRNYFEKDGRRYSHTISPLSGYPITHNLASVTVVADNCASADGLATALNVMGFEAGIVLAEEKNLAALFIIKSAEGFEEVRSQALSVYLENTARKGNTQ